MKYGFVIPVYNHGSTLESVIESLLKFDFPIIVVDDGNDEKNKEFIKAADDKYNCVTVVTREKNGGKGKAMQDGVRKADEMGISHVFQIDSDGQHDVSRVEYFLEKSKEHPEAVICGYPAYDEDAPMERVHGRKFANMWIHIVTLSSEIKDAMIGFRVYPVKPYIKVIDRCWSIDSRMGFDIDILVRLNWAGVPIVSEQVKVFYPEDGISNYRYIVDTAHISLTYAKLCLGMILRLPILIARKFKRRNR